MVSRVLMLLSGFYAGEDFYADCLRRRGIGVSHSLRVENIRWRRGVRRLHLNSRLGGKKFWFDEWESLVDAAELVIVHSNDLAVASLEYIHRRWPHKRVVAWYWNVSGPGNDVRRARDYAEVWSFDKEDCRHFGLRYNTQYGFRELCEFNGRPETDVLFLGVDKGRAELLDGIAYDVREAGFHSKVEVVGMRSEEAKRFNRIQSSDGKRYGDYLRDAGRARVLLEVPREGQRGLTLRSVEALMMGKGLLTPARNVLCHRGFDDSWVCVYESGNVGGLRRYLERERFDCDQSIRDYYDFSSWLERFG